MPRVGRDVLLAWILLLALPVAPAHPIEAVTAEHGVAAGGDIRESTITIGLTPMQVRELIDRVLGVAGVDPDKVAELATELGVHQGAVTTFLRTIGEKAVPVEELPAKLGEIAEHHKALLAQIEFLRPEGADVEAIHEQARAAIEEGDSDRAERLLVEAEQSALRSIKGPLIDAAALRAGRGELALTRLDYPEAAAHFAVAADRVPASESLVQADYLNREGLAAVDAGDYAQAGAALEKALELRELHLDPNDAGLGVSLNNLAQLYCHTGRYAEAEPLYERALAIGEASLGQDHPNIASVLDNLAGLYHETGRYAEAEPLYKRAIEIDKKALGPDHPGLAIDLNNLAGLYSDTGRYAEAEPLSEQALEISEAVHGPDHPDVAMALNNLAALYRDTGRYAEAKPLYERAIVIAEAGLGQDHPNVATALNNLARLYHDMGRYAEAEPLYEQAIAISEAAFGPEHPSLVVDLDNLAALYRETGRYVEAKPLYERALTICEERLGPNHPTTEIVRANLDSLRSNSGDGTLAGQ